MGEKETLVIGGPGCGKTSFLVAQTKIAAKKHGSDKVMVCSLTKAAANEAASRDSGLMPNMIGTLHALCFRALGQPKMAESKEGMEIWNAENKKSPLRVSSSNVEDCGIKEHTGASGPSQKFDMYLQQANLLRAKKAPDLYWTRLVKGFYNRWCDFKKEHDFMDFADLIEHGTDLLYAPGNPNVIFADEAQDLSCAEHDLLMKWSRRAQKLVIVADRDQSLYYWRGSSEDIADPKRFKDENIRVLSQSYRVPKAVHKKAVNLIRRHSNRVDVEYKSTDVEGRVYRSAATYKDPKLLEPIIDKAVNDNKSIMVLGSCSYMIDPLIKRFREVGIPYGNPYSKRWAPLRRSATQVYDYLKPSREFNNDPSFWTIKELKNVVHNVMKSKIFRSRMGGRIEALPDDISQEDMASVIREVMLPDVLVDFMEFDPVRFLKYFPQTKRDAMKYPVGIVKRFSRDHLITEPNVTVGTIHSVKGGEADLVILFPDLSIQGYKQYKARGFGGRDAIIRMFYVGVTRAREELIICNPCGGSYAKEVISGT